MPKLYYPLEACKQNATERQTAYAASVLHLFQSSLVTNPNTTAVLLTAATATFKGYAPENLFPWFDPGLAPGSGYMTASPLVQFQYNSTAMTGDDSNLIGGAYLLDGAGKLRMLLQFVGPDEYVSMSADGNILDINLADLFPTGF